ncbi:GNAT family N-acetyltransferase [Photobacterium gaetbulicola]|uniref:N-acetyltransferase domain-containing protein n=1 Tax=Photobacterium gaetbulicola Gung47 TaxID=658445 RepID=A0A0C5WAD6_9GAMM|nr:GNAT family N-acetyltransferase [Photobacterium gaetbulicola]AJR08556.1 hypothetical protein H744_2c1890 [Photobacterium gaetbulicola Gung47]PSU01597.1 GNAT family N-acetyltransferase [Photobacterium gaetbulicola]
MELLNAEKEHYQQIGRLVNSAEELYTICPSGSYPWDEEQLSEIAETRLNLTICSVEGCVAAFGNIYNVVPGESAFIGNIIVGDNYKGQGIGKKLIQYLSELCEESYDAIPHISVFGFNTHALLLYTRLGFVPYAIEERTSLNGETVALIHMHLDS